MACRETASITYACKRPSSSRSLPPRSAMLSMRESLFPISTTSAEWCPRLSSGFESDVERPPALPESGRRHAKECDEPVALLRRIVHEARVHAKRHVLDPEAFRLAKELGRRGAAVSRAGIDEQEA